MNGKDYLFEQLVQKINPQNKLLRTWELKGGVSAQVTAFEIERPDGQRQKMVVRQHGAEDLKQNPRVAADEFKLLQLLQTVGLAAPAPYFLDQSGQIFPTPYVVIEYIEGKPEFAPSNLADLILQLATYLARLHRVDASHYDLSFLPPLERLYGKKLGNWPMKVAESLAEGRIRATLAPVWPLPQRNPSVLLHGDFWPGNILWRDNRLVAVIDWEDAALGDPLADLANSRLEMLWAFGRKAMQRFTHQYQALAAIDLANLPYWDLCAALRPASKLAGWGLDPATEQAMRAKHRWFVTQAFEKLAG